MGSMAGPWELGKLHAWIMQAMKQGIIGIIAHVPKSVFLGHHLIHGRYRFRGVARNVLTTKT